MNVREVARRVRESGPIDVYLSETEYDALKEVMRSLWRDPRWSAEERLFALAFLRGYTFYREPSEHESRFWQGFHSELGLDQGLPLPWQYNNLWDAFSSNPDLSPLLAYDGRGRAFVTTIDAAWGIRSLRAQALTDFFIKYYLEYPGEVITRDLMQHILDNPDESILRQAPAYDRIFRAMNGVISAVLEHDLEELAVDQLETELLTLGVDLGQPNALRYFVNKSSGALDTILERLRFQRTIPQFRRYLQRFPNRQFVSPSGSNRSGSDLADAELAYGRYFDISSNEDHFVVPATHVSLQLLESLPLGAFSAVAGFATYIARTPFFAQIGSISEASVPLYTRLGPRHLWLGNVSKGTRLEVKGIVHPRCVGWEAAVATRLVWKKDIPKLQGSLSLNTCLPDGSMLLKVTAGNEAFTVPAIGQGRFIFDLPRENLDVHFETFETWTWPAKNRLFTAQGNEVSPGAHRHGPRTLYLVAKTPPGLDRPGVQFEPIPGPLPLWRICWDGAAPLRLGAWEINAPFRELRRNAAPNRQRRRSDIHLTLLDGIYEQGSRIEIDLDGSLPPGATLRIDNQMFAPRGKTFFVDYLAVGTYVPEIVQGNEVVAELEPLRVIPHLKWEFPRDSVLISGHTYVTRLVLPDGRFETFRWKPRLDFKGQPVKFFHNLELDDFQVRFELEADCYAAKFVVADSDEPLAELRGLAPGTHDLQVHNPYDRDLSLRLRLASAPNAAVAPHEVGDLKPTARDQLLVEICTDKRSDLWSVVTRADVRVKPVVSGFKIEGGFCSVYLLGPKDFRIRLEELEPRSGKLVAREIEVSPGNPQRFKLSHPEKLRPILVRLGVTTASEPGEYVWLEQTSPPHFDLEDYLQRGVGWSVRG